MTDEIRSLTQRLADEPASLAFLELGEALRRRGQLEAAYKVARGGLSRYPGLADAHDLMGRILTDQGDLAGAFDAWADALRFDPMRTGALKGIAFLYFRAGDVEAALEHLSRAGEADPDDPAIPPALARLRREARTAGRAGFDPVADVEVDYRTTEPAAGAPAQEPGPAAEPAREQPAPESPDAPPAAAGPAAAEDSPFTELEDRGRGLLLVDAQGQRLAGALAGGSDETGDRVAAHLAGITREAARATRLLGLGSWHSIAVEAPDAHLFLSAPTGDTVLLALRDSSLPMARLGLLAERAGRIARGWLEQVR